MASEENNPNNAKDWLLFFLPHLRQLPDRIHAAFFQDNWPTENCQLQVERHFGELSSKPGESHRETNEETQRLREEIDDLKKRLEKERSYRHERDAKFKELYEAKSREVDDFKARYAAVSERRVQLDQRKVENTLSRTRQSKVEEYYNEFSDGRRLDAVERLEEPNSGCRSYSARHYGSSIKQQLRYQRLTCKIFEIAYETALKVKEAFIQHSVTIVDSLPQQAIKLGLVSIQKNSYEMPLSGGVLDPSQHEITETLLLALKEDAESCNIKELVQEVKRSIKVRFKENDSLLRKLDDTFMSRVKEFIKEATRLAWILVTQVPPLVLDYKLPSKYDREMHVASSERRPHSVASKPVTPGRFVNDPYSSQHEAKDYVFCYLWPVLLDKDRKVVVKGKVVLAT